MWTYVLQHIKVCAFFCALEGQAIRSDSILSKTSKIHLKWNDNDTPRFFQIFLCSNSRLELISGIIHFRWLCKIIIWCYGDVKFLHAMDCKCWGLRESIALKAISIIYTWLLYYINFRKRCFDSTFPTFFCSLFWK